MTQARLEATRALYAQIRAISLPGQEPTTRYIAGSYGKVLPLEELHGVMAEAYNGALKRIQIQGKQLKADMETVK